MLRKTVNRLLIIVISLFIGGVFVYNFAQKKKEELFTKQKKIQQEIKYTNMLLDATSKKKGKTIQNIKLIDSKIKKRKDLINLYQRDIVSIEADISQKESKVVSLNSELERQKKYYSDFIYYAYKNYDNYNSTVYLLASNTLNQFYMRRKYMEQLREARIEKMNLIHAIRIEIDKELEEQKIPRFIIQPLVENAVKHGISKSVDGGDIKVKITKEGRITLIVVSDSGQAFPDDLTPGFGIQSIYDKLEILYKDKFEMNFTNSPQKQVTLKLK